METSYCDLPKSKFPYFLYYQLMENREASFEDMFAEKSTEEKKLGRKNMVEEFSLENVSDELQDDNIKYEATDVTNVAEYFGVEKFSQPRSFREIFEKTKEKVMKHPNLQKSHKERDTEIRQDILKDKEKGKTLGT
jgi:hypothetical protein